MQRKSSELAIMDFRGEHELVMTDKHVTFIGELDLNIEYFMNAKQSINDSKHSPNE